MKTAPDPDLCRCCSYWLQKRRRPGGRLEGYCDVCAANRCDRYGRSCGRPRPRG